MESTVQVKVAGLASVFPASSFARTSTVCSPSDSPSSVKLADTDSYAPPSRRASNTESSSVASAVKLALVWLLNTSGVVVSDVSGGVESTGAGGDGLGEGDPPPPPPPQPADAATMLTSSAELR